MLKKKHLLILGFLLVLICTISNVSAADNPDNLTDSESDNALADGITGECGTFRDLDKLVYEHYIVELDRDYAYDSEIDNYDSEKDYYNLKSGVWIGHDLYLDGKNHTVYANGARTFFVYEGVHNVFIYNLNFVNIYSPEFLETYTGNFYYDGGALLNAGEIYLENCTFINNYALEQGGAIVNADNATLYLNRCKFINNSVPEMGLEVDNGGAISSHGRLWAANCSFYNSIAFDGGAIASFYESYIIDSYFENNRAITKGGAIYNDKDFVCEVNNCIFKTNVAAYGGAIYNGISSNCYFYGDNRATTKKGHNMNLGVNKNCSSEINSTENYYKVINSKSFSFKPIDLVINETDNANLQILVSSNPNGEGVSGVYLNLRIEDEDGDYGYYLLRSDENGIANLSLSNFGNGTYKLTAFFVDSNYNDTQMNYTLVLGKVKSVIHFYTSIVFEYGSTGSVQVKVEGGTIKRENIHVDNYTDALIDLEEDIISISGLDVGNYTLRVISSPDENHSASVGTINISVVKAVAVIKASKLTVALKKGTLWSIALQDSTNHKPIKGMELTLKVYTGSKYKTVTVKTNSKGVATYKTSSLSKGTHKIVVTGKHSGYKFNTLTSYIKVIKPRELTFKLQKRVNDNKGSLISYIVKDKKTGKGVNGVKIKLKIYTGKTVKTVTLKSKKIKGKKQTYNGAFGYSTNELSVGKHIVIIEPASISYSGSAKTSMIIKKAAKKGQKYSHKI